jgi:lysophospholipase L1-like esterase
MRIGFFGDSLTEGRPGVSYVDILRERFPNDELLNYGRGGDSVIGTRERAGSLDVESPFDLAFVWTGVNDILAHISWASPWTRRLLGEPWAETREQFIAEYRLLLGELSLIASRIVAVAPLFIGEDLSNPWNRELEAMSGEIEALSGAFPRVEYINPRSRLKGVPSARCSSEYVEKSGLGTVWEAVVLRDPEEVDRVAAERGLCYTLDGIHLNSRGANAIADLLADAIRRAAKASEPKDPARG